MRTFFPFTRFMLAAALTLCAVPATALMAADVTINVDANQIHQTWYGFGCTHGSGIFGPTDTMTASQRAQFVDMLFNQVRIRTGQIPSAFEAPANSGVNFFTNQANDDGNPFNINWNGFCTFFSDQYKAKVVDLAPAAATTELYPDVHINTRWASKWLETIRAGNYNSFLDECAEQVLAQMIDFKNKYGREPLYAHLFNEPTSGNGEVINGSDVLIADIVARCGDRLRANGFNTVKFVVASQETEESSLATAQAVMANAGAAKYVGAIAYHTYPYGSMYSYIPNILNSSGKGLPDSSRIAVRGRIRDLGKQYGVPVWMTEVSNGFYGDNTASNLDSFTGARGRAIHIHDEMLYAEASAFFGMNANWSFDANQLHFGSGATGANPDDIIFVDQPNNRVFITGMGRAIGHYARFMNNGAKVLTATSSNPLVQISSATDSATGKLIAVIINNDTASHSIALTVNGLSINGNVSGEQSTAAAFWQAMTPFAVTSASGYTVTVPGQSITSCSATIGTIANRPPVINSGPSALPGAATIGQAVSFAVAASDPDNDPLTYQWDFGDGATLTGSSVTHAYASPGNYTATITISDGRGGQVSATAVVSVTTAPPATYALTVNLGSGSGLYPAGTTVTIVANAPLTGQLFDAWAGAAVANAKAATTTLTMPAAAVTVTAMYKNAPPPNPLTLTKLTGVVFFNSAGKDTYKVTGSINSASLIYSDAVVALDVGGAQVTFTLNAKGLGVSSNGTIKFSKSGSTQKFVAALKKGTWAAPWTQSGLTNEPQTNVAIPISVVMTINGAANAGNKYVQYSEAHGVGRIK